MPITHTKVSTVADGSTTDHIRPSDWNAAHTIAGTVTLSSGVASSAPLIFTAGTNLTSAAAGAMEYDGNCFYNTAIAGNRQVNLCSQVGTIAGAYAIATDSSGNQKFFNPSTNGAVNVGPNQSYLFETGFQITNLSTVAGTVGWAFGGTANVSAQNWQVMSVRAAATSVPTACLISYHTAASTACLAASSTVGQVTAFIKGKVVITTSGTLIPQVFYGSSGVTGAPTVSAGAYFVITPIGTNAVEAVGGWT